jgi:hypothetical protein
LAGGEKKLANEPQLQEVFALIVENRTAGSPMLEKVRWTSLKDSQIVRLFEEKGHSISRFMVKQLTELAGLAKRRMKKTLEAKEVVGRDGQFQKIGDLKEEYAAGGLPVLSVDTKKKEFIGQFYRNGKSYCKESVEVFDHDFPSLAEGRVVPHGIYDVKLNKGYLSIGKSRDTSEFLCDNLKYYWENQISRDYPEATEMLLLMDGGGSNSCLHYIVKEDLQNPANDLQMTITVAHYPPYCSKYNPIEHRLFPHLQRSWEGVLFSDYEIVKERAEKTTTKKGLKVVAWINEKLYQSGRKYSADFKETMTIAFDELLPKWNYQIHPL